MVVVIGGQRRKAGKTSLAAALIAALPEAGFTAVKITGHAHGGTFSKTRLVERTGDYLLLEQVEPDTTDTGRYLAAGARRALWFQARSGRLGQAEGAIRRLLAGGGNFIVESNSVLEFLTPDFCLMVLDPEAGEFKESCRRLLDRADALVIRGCGPPAGEVPVRGRPVIAMVSPDYAPEAVIRLVRSRLASGNSAMKDNPDGEV